MVHLSAADFHWPEMIQAVAIQFGQKLSRTDVLKMSIQERSNYLCQNPVTGVCMFQYQLESSLTVPPEFCLSTWTYKRLCN